MSKGEKREASPPTDPLPMAKRHTRNHNRSELLGHDLEGETMSPFGDDLSHEDWRIWNHNRQMEWAQEKEAERMAAAARAKRGGLTAEDLRSGIERPQAGDYTAQKPRGWFARFIEWVGR